MNPTLKELDCVDMSEVCQRVRFQDWITTYCGYLNNEHRNNLWSALKRGHIIGTKGGTIRVLEKARINPT